MGDVRCQRCGGELTGQAVQGICANCALHFALDGHGPADEADPLLQSQPTDSRSLGLFGDYELLEEIAQGGMGVVYRARQVSLNRTVALKMILPGHFSSAALVQRFQTEAETAARLDHPNIVPIYEVGRHAGQHYFTMRFLEGGTLTDAMARERFDPRRAAELMVTVARAVHHAHQRGILHRDLKPGNILLDLQGKPHVADFGLAKLLETDASLTRSQAILGSPSYMAPEQAAGRPNEVSTATDVYGLGAILYELLTGKPPFKADTAMNTLRLVIENNPARPRHVSSTIDRDLETICLKCLEKEPVSRYGSAAAFADDLQHWLDREPISARPVNPWERAAKWARREPVAAALALVSLLAAAALFGIGISVPAYLEARRSRDGELEQRRRAEQAREEAEKARQTEAEARKGEQEQRQLAQNALAELQKADYVKNLSIAGRDLLAGDILNAETVLDDCPAQLRHWEWNYLKRLCLSQPGAAFESSRILLTNNQMYGVAYDSEGTTLMALGARGIWLVDAANGNVLFTREGGFRGRINSSPNGTYFGYGAPGTTGMLYDACDREETALGHKDIYDLSFSPDGETLATCQGTPGRQPCAVALWSVSSGKILDTLLQSTNGFTAVRFSPDGKWLAAAESNYRFSQFVSRALPSPRIIHIWNTETKQLVHTLEGHRYGIWRIAFTPDGKRLVSAAGLYSGGAPGEIKVWDVEAGRELLDLKGQRNCVFALAITPDGKRLVSGEGDISGRNRPQEIRIWDLSDGRQLFSLKSHTGTVYDLAFSANGDRLASASIDGTLRVWDASPLTETQLDLSSHFNALLDTPSDARSNLADLPRGLQRLGGIKFNVRGLIQLKGTNTHQLVPELIEGIQVRKHLSRIHFLHATDSDVPTGTRVGNYTIRFADGETQIQPIVYGDNVRDWQTTAESTSKTPHAGVAWKSQDGRSRVFRTFWTNPRPDIEIQSIDFVSSMAGCAPFLLAITVE